MKPIKEGCLAVTINCSIPENNGIGVTVGKFLGAASFDFGDDAWEVDKIIKKCNYYTDKPLDSDYIISGRYLLRIDGGDFEEEAEQEEVLIDEISEG